jgi:hypothetical protein
MLLKRLYSCRPVDILERVPGRGSVERAAAVGEGAPPVAVAPVVACDHVIAVLVQAGGTPGIDLTNFYVCRKLFRSFKIKFWSKILEHSIADRSFKNANKKGQTFLKKFNLLPGKPTNVYQGKQEKYGSENLH